MWALYWNRYEHFWTWILKTGVAELVIFKGSFTFNNLFRLFHFGAGDPYSGGPNTSSAEFPLMYVTYLFPSPGRIVVVLVFIRAWCEYTSLSECQNTFSPAKQEEKWEKWHSLSCSCPNKHYIFKFVYFNSRKATLLQTHSFWGRTVDILVIIRNDTFQSDAAGCVMTNAGCLDIVKTQARYVVRVVYLFLTYSYR